MTLPQQQGPLDFEAVEHQLNLDNLQEMASEISQRSDRLATRIFNFSAKFEMPEENFWRALEADPNGPLAAVLAREARRQNVHENAAAEYVKQMGNVQGFQKLKLTGPNARYINGDGQVVIERELGGTPRPSEAIDFQWRSGTVTCYAAQKYTKEGGGNQDSRFDETIRLLNNFQKRPIDDTVLFVLVDGPYYNEDRLRQLRALVHSQCPRSYVLGINHLQPILNQIAAGGANP